MKFIIEGLICGSRGIVDDVMDDFSLLFHTEITRCIVLNHLKDPGVSECRDRDLEDQVLIFHDICHVTKCIIEVGELLSMFGASSFALRGIRAATN